MAWSPLWTLVDSVIVKDAVIPPFFDRPVMKFWFRSGLPAHSEKSSKLDLRIKFVVKQFLFSFDVLSQKILPKLGLFLLRKQLGNLKMISTLVITDRIRSMEKGNVFTSVCDSVDGGVWYREGVCSIEGMSAPPGGGGGGGVWAVTPLEMATAAVGTHLTGMDFCFILFFERIFLHRNWWE